MNDWVPELGRIGHVHIVAIGGAAMSALAHILLAEGHRVSGSDQNDGPVLDALRNAGAKVWIGHDPRHIDGADLVAVSTAIGPGNPELDAAIAQGIPVLVRGGGRVSDLEILTRTKALMDEGARGIVYGRNVVQHANPGGMTRALMAIVHDNVSVKAAGKLLK